MANCAHITRRSIFKLAPAAVLAAGGAVAAFPLSASAEQDTKIIQLLREYNRLTVAASEHHCVTNDEDEELEQLFYSPRDLVEDELLAAPCTCAADFAAKMIVATYQGEGLPDWKTDQIFIEARHLTGWATV